MSAISRITLNLKANFNSFSSTADFRISASSASNVSIKVLLMHAVVPSKMLWNACVITGISVKASDFPPISGSVTIGVRGVI